MGFWTLSLKWLMGKLIKTKTEVNDQKRLSAEVRGTRLQVYSNRSQYPAKLGLSCNQSTNEKVGRKKEGNVLFNDALNTLYLRLYDVRHMVKDHSNSERGNLLPPHGLLFLISSKGSLMHYPTDKITHTTAFVTPVMEHGWNEK